MIRYEEEWYESPDDEQTVVKPRTKKRDKVHSKWRPLRQQRPKVVKGFGR
jgi:hypothetical protein